MSFDFDIGYWYTNSFYNALSIMKLTERELMGGEGRRNKMKIEK